MDHTPDNDADQLRRAAGGDVEAWRGLVARHHDRLRRMVALRLDPRLRGRVDPSDVMQDAYLEATQQLPAYVANPTMPAFLWLRYLAAHRLGRVHRQHLGARMRDASRDVSITCGAGPEASSMALAEHLLGRDARPSEAAVAAERRQRLQSALELLGRADREILALRHFEQLTGPEAARILDVSPAAAGKRYIRAVSRLRELMAGLPGGLRDFSL